MAKKLSTQFKYFSIAPDTYTSGKVVYIYALCNPLKYHVIFYIGKTEEKNVNIRWKSEISEARLRKCNCKRCNFIREILKFGVFPVGMILEICDENNWKSREKYWIKHYRQLGYEIANVDFGGMNLRGPVKHSEETRLKMSLVRRGVKFSERVCFSRKGKKRNPYNVLNRIGKSRGSYRKRK